MGMLFLIYAFSIHAHFLRSATRASNKGWFCLVKWTRIEALHHALVSILSFSPYSNIPLAGVLQTLPVVLFLSPDHPSRMMLKLLFCTLRKADKLQAAASSSVLAWHLVPEADLLQTPRLWRLGSSSIVLSNALIVRFAPYLLTDIMCIIRLVTNVSLLKTRIGQNVADLCNREVLQRELTVLPTYASEPSRLAICTEPCCCLHRLYWIKVKAAIPTQHNHVPLLQFVTTTTSVVIGFRSCLIISLEIQRPLYITSELL